MDTILRDIRFGLKLIWKDKAFSSTVLVTLAICIGANVAIFSVIQAVLLNPLPYDGADRMVNILNSYPGAGAERAGAGPVDFFQRRDGIDAFESVAVLRGSSFTMGEAGSTENVQSLHVSASLLPLLGVTPRLGRGFTEEEMEEGQHRVALLTHGFWEEYYGGSPGAVGQDLRLDGEAYQVVGVLPSDFSLVGAEEARFLLPTAFSEEDRSMESWHSNNYQMLARLKPGVSIELARSQIAALNTALIEEWPVPGAAQLLEDARFETLVVDAQADLIRDVRPMLYMLWAGVVFVLLIGCVNIANLMLTRAQARASEMATKLALGADRGRLARQVMTESLVLGVIGTAVGVGAGAGGLRLLTFLGADALPRRAEIGIDGPVLLFALGLAIGAGVLFGSIPMVHAFRSDLSSALRSEGRTGTSSRGAVLLRNSMVMGQVALALVMLTGAGLMLASFRAAVSVDPGFRAEGVLSANVSLPQARYPSGEARRQFTDDLLSRVRALPGVTAAGISTGLPFTGSNSNSVIAPEGWTPQPGESLLSPRQAFAGPGYFESLDIEILEGRTFTASDDPSSRRVIIIDEWLARRYWPDSSPLGQRMVFGQVPGADSIPESALYSIVGVVETIKHDDLTAPESEHVGAYYFTYTQGSVGSLTLSVHAATEAASLTTPIRTILNQIDSELPLFGVRTMESLISDSLVSRRAPMALLVIFGGVALFLAVIGIYGALAYSVQQRTKEMGIRLAMGSSPASLFRIVIGQGLRITGLGLVIGAVSALLLSRLIESMLFGVQPTNPAVVASVAVLLAVVAVVACAVPARRATRLDPVTALNHQ